MYRLPGGGVRPADAGGGVYGLVLGRGDGIGAVGATCLASWSRRGIGVPVDAVSACSAAAASSPACRRAVGSFAMLVRMTTSIRRDAGRAALAWVAPR